LGRDDRIEPGDAATLARVVSAIMFVGMASPANITSTVDEIVQEIRDQVRVLLAR
jgi:TetR/AcrR family transcriptional regulator